ncbi:hypothetical protein ES703_82425 [subsurface metagenome]
MEYEIIAMESYGWVVQQAKDEKRDFITEEQYEVRIRMCSHCRKFLEGGCVFCCLKPWLRVVPSTKCGLNKWPIIKNEINTIYTCN